MKNPRAYEEVELKRLLLGDDAADKLIVTLGSVSADKQQVNHILDTNDGRWRKQRYALRLRFEDGTPILTAKAPSRQVGSDTQARTEAEVILDQALAEEVLAARRDPVQVLRERCSDAVFEPLFRGLSEARAAEPLVEVGRFENRRRVVPVCLPSGLALAVEVDRTRFPNGRVSDEVEIEVPSEAVVPEVETWLEGRASAAGISTARSSSKIARFYAALEAGKP